MPRSDFEDDWLEEDDEVEDGSDDQDDVFLCPSCRRDVHEDTQQCPHCGDWITPVHPQSAWKRSVFIAAAVIAILGMLLVTLW